MIYLSKQFEKVVQSYRRRYDRVCEVGENGIGKHLLEVSLVDSLYLTDYLDDVPETERWDLVVGISPNPKRFYQYVGKYLNHNAIIVIAENHDKSVITEFWHMADQGGLVIKDSFPDNVYTNMYYIILKNRPTAHQSLASPPC